MAEPIPFKEANTNLTRGKNHESVCDLPVCRADTEVGPVVISCWRLTKPEIEEVVRTGHVWLTVLGSTTPPVAVAAKSPFDR